MFSKCLIIVDNYNSFENIHVSNSNRCIPVQTVLNILHVWIETVIFSVVDTGNYDLITPENVMQWRSGRKEGKKNGENHRKMFNVSDLDQVDVKEGKDGWKKGEEGSGNISSCCTGSSSPIDVSTACTRVLSTSYQHRWAARSVPQQEKIQDNCEALIVLPPPHFSQTLTFSKESLTSETIPLLASIKIEWEKQKRWTLCEFVWNLWDTVHLYF